MDDKRNFQDETLVEHNDLIKAHYEMSAPEQDIFSLIIAQIKQDDSGEKRYRISVRDIEDLTKKEVNYARVGKIAKKLLRRVCTIFRENGDPLYTSMIADAEYMKNTGCIEIGISSKLRPYLFNLKENFTRYQLRMFGPLRSKFSKRIYKMLSQFKDTGVMYVSVEELKKRLNLIDINTGKELFKTFTIFERKVLETAKKEINEFTDLRCTYDLKKTGRKYTHIQFKIDNVLMYQSNAVEKIQKEFPNLYDRLTKKFSLNKWQAINVITYVPEARINKILYEINVQHMNNKIDNLGGYTAKLFDQAFNLGFFKKPSETANTPA